MKYWPVQLHIRRAQLALERLLSLRFSLAHTRFTCVSLVSFFTDVGEPRRALSCCFEILKRHLPKEIPT